MSLQMHDYQIHVKRSVKYYKKDMNISAYTAINDKVRERWESFNGGEGIWR